MTDVRGWHAGNIECIVTSGVDEIKTDLNITIIGSFFFISNLQHSFSSSVVCIFSAMSTFYFRCTCNTGSA